MGRTGYQRTYRTRVVSGVAAGVDWELRAPGNAWLRVISLVATLTTDATVIDRRVRLVAGDGSNRWFTSISSAAQAAGATVEYGAYVGADTGGSATLALTLPLPTEGLLLRPGHRLQSLTANLQAGDAWTLINVLLDEIPSDTRYVSNIGALPDQTEG